MAGGGEYNRFGGAQSGAHDISYPALHAALTRLITCFPSEHALVVADLGCSQGANSIPTMRLVVGRLRAGLPATPVMVYHNDLPTNDFNSLMTVLSGPGGSGLAYAPPGDTVLSGPGGSGLAYAPPGDTQYVHAYALGRSFYLPLFPPDTVHLCLSFITLHWLSCAPPAGLKGSRIFSCTAPTPPARGQGTCGGDAGGSGGGGGGGGDEAWRDQQEREQDRDPCGRSGGGGAGEVSVNVDEARVWRDQARQDLQAWLALRAAELRGGGELCVVMVAGRRNSFTFPPPGPAGRQGGGPGGVPVISAVLEEMQRRGLVSAREVDCMAVPYHLRSEAEVLEAAEAAAPGVLRVREVRTTWISWLGQNPDPDLEGSEPAAGEEGSGPTAGEEGSGPAAGEVRRSGSQEEGGGGGLDGFGGAAGPGCGCLLGHPWADHRGLLPHRAACGGGQ